MSVPLEHEGGLIGGVNALGDDVGNDALEHLEHSFRGPGFLELGEAVEDPQAIMIRLFWMRLLHGNGITVSFRVMQRGKNRGNSNHLFYKHQSSAALNKCPIARVFDQPKLTQLPLL